MKRAWAVAGWSSAVVLTFVAGCATSLRADGTGGSSPGTSGTTTSSGGVEACGSVTGHQATGTSAPIVAGPASGTVHAGTSFTVVGVGITDADAATNPGAMVVQVSVNAGTLAMTVDDAPVAGSGTSSITYSGSLSAIDAALASLTYAAPGAATSDVLRITPTDQFGQSNALSIPITVTPGAMCAGAGGAGGSSSSGSGGSSTGTGGATSVPTDPTGVTAQRIADMMEILGANVFSNGQDHASGETVAGLTAASQYLVGDSGLTMLFRGYVSSASDYSTFGPAVFAATGSQFTLAMGIGDTPDPSGVITLAQSSASQGNWVKFIEGGNEPNTNFGSYQTGVAPSVELAAMQKIYAAVHPLGIPVAAPSVVGSDSGIASYWGSSLTGAVAATDRYNTHLYPNNGGPNGANQLHDWSIGVSTMDWGAKRGIVSEWQPVLYNQKATDDASCAYWAPIMLLSGFVDFQLEAIVWYELFDYPGFSPHVGMFADTAEHPYPAANALKAMYGLTGDKGPAKHTFTPGKLDVTVTGLPTGDNAYAGGRYAVFQNSSPGTFFVFVWNEQDALATGTTTPVTVKFNAGPMARVVDYSLTNPTSASPTPKQSLTGVSEVTLDLTTEVRLLQVTHP